MNLHSRYLLPYLLECVLVALFALAACTLRAQLPQMGEVEQARVAAEKELPALLKAAAASPEGYGFDNAAQTATATLGQSFDFYSCSIHDLKAVNEEAAADVLFRTALEVAFLIEAEGKVRSLLALTRTPTGWKFAYFGYGALAKRLASLRAAWPEIHRDDTRIVFLREIRLPLYSIRGQSARNLTPLTAATIGEDLKFVPPASLRDTVPMATTLENLRRLATRLPQLPDK